MLRASSICCETPLSLEWRAYAQGLEFAVLAGLSILAVAASIAVPLGMLAAIIEAAGFTMRAWNEQAPGMATAGPSGPVPPAPPADRAQPEALPPQ